jgi:hypothetical protein
MLGGVGLADLAGSPVGLLDAACEPDRVGAVSGPADLALLAGQPGRVGRRLGQLIGGGHVDRGDGPQRPNSSRGSHARATSLLESGLVKAQLVLRAAALMAVATTERARPGLVAAVADAAIAGRPPPAAEVDHDGLTATGA